MRKKRISKLMIAVSVLLCLSCIFGCVPAYASGYTQPEAKNDNAEVRFPFIIAPFQSSPGFFEEVKAWILIGTEMKVKGYSGNYTYVEISETGEKGYIHYIFIDDDRNGQLYLNKDFDHVYVGKNNSNRIKVTYTGSKTIKWSSKPEGYVSIDQETGLITGINPGTVTVTVKAGSKSDDCTVTCINERQEKETSKTTKKVYIKKNPGDEYEDRGSVSSGTSIKALGDLADGSGWIYVGANNIYGFVKLSDFPGIDYLMTQYHYYDEGYEERFGSAISKISDYASVLNDVMTASFGLKVCYYVKQYTSVADQCKIWKYQSIYLENLSGSCPKISPHKTDSCLQTSYLREELKNQFGNGGGIVSKVSWTGHIMSNYETDRSNATVGIGTVIITPYATTNPNNNFSNYSSDKIRRESLYTIVHETGHQLNLHDHYCRKDFSEQTGKCTNKFCVTCNKLPYSDDCIMLDRINVETVAANKIYCDYCQNTIENYLSDKF